MNPHPSEPESHSTSDWFIRIVGKISTLCGWISAAMIVAAVAITCQMIFLRAVLNQSTIWQTEAVVYLMVSATLLGLPYVQRLRGHVNVDLLPLMLPFEARRILGSAVLIATILVVGMMAFYAFEQWYEAWAKNWRSDTVWGVRLWIPYFAIPVGFCVFLLQLLADLLGVLSRRDKSCGMGSAV